MKRMSTYQLLVIQTIFKDNKKYIQNLVDLTKDNDCMFLNLALNYGGKSGDCQSHEAFMQKSYYKKIFLLNKLMKNPSLKT